MATMMPGHYEYKYDDCRMKEADIALTQWALYWQDNKDHGFGLGFPKISTFERINHVLCGDGFGELTPMTPLVELVDQTLLKLPYNYRVVAWVWWVELNAMQYRTAEKICRGLGVKVAYRTIREMVMQITIAVSVQL